MEITYCRTHDGETRVRTIEPVGILFSEYYFYLAAFIEGIDKDKHFQNPQDNSPTIYRIDRIQNYKTLDRHFAQRYTDRFQEGEDAQAHPVYVRRRVADHPVRVYRAKSGIRSRPIPTAKVLQVTEKGWIIEAEVFGHGYPYVGEKSGRLCAGTGRTINALGKEKNKMAVPFILLVARRWPASPVL